MHVRVVAAGQHRENFLLVKNATSYLLCPRSFMDSLPSSTGTRQGVSTGVVLPPRGPESVFGA